MLLQICNETVYCPAIKYCLRYLNNKGRSLSVCLSVCLCVPLLLWNSSTDSKNILHANSPHPWECLKKLTRWEGGPFSLFALWRFCALWEIGRTDRPISKIFRMTTPLIHGSAPPPQFDLLISTRVIGLRKWSWFLSSSDQMEPEASIAANGGVNASSPYFWLIIIGTKILIGLTSSPNNTFFYKNKSSEIGKIK